MRQKLGVSAQRSTPIEDIRNKRFRPNAPYSVRGPLIVTDPQVEAAFRRRGHVYAVNRNCYAPGQYPQTLGIPMSRKHSRRSRSDGSLSVAPAKRCEWGERSAARSDEPHASYRLADEPWMDPMRVVG